MRFGWVLAVLMVITLAPDLAWADEACLAEVKALRAEIADDSRLLAKARGDLDHAMELCRADEADEARAIMQAIRDQAGMSMGQGR